MIDVKKKADELIDAVNASYSTCSSVVESFLSDFRGQCRDEAIEEVCDKLKFHSNGLLERAREHYKLGQEGRYQEAANDSALLQVAVEQIQMLKSQPTT